MKDLLKILHGRVPDPTLRVCESLLRISACLTEALGFLEAPDFFLMPDFDYGTGAWGSLFHALPWLSWGAFGSQASDLLVDRPSLV